MKNSVFTNDFVMYEENVEAGNEVARFADEFTEKGIYYDFRKLYLVCNYGLLPLALISVFGGLLYVSNLLNLPYYLSYPIAFCLLLMLEMLYSYTLSIVLKGAFIQRYSFLFQISCFAFAICLFMSVYTTSNGIYIFAKQYESETSKISLISLDSVSQIYEVKKQSINQKFDAMRDKLNNELSNDANFYAYDVAKSLIKDKKQAFSEYEILRKKELENLEMHKVQNLEKAQKENDLLKLETKIQIETNVFQYVWLVILCEFFKLSFIFISNYYRFRSAKQGLITQTVPKPQNIIPIHSTFKNAFESMFLDFFKSSNPMQTVSNSNSSKSIETENQNEKESQILPSEKRKVGFEFEKMKTEKLQIEKNAPNFDELKKYFDKSKYKGEYQNLFVALVASKILEQKINLSSDFLMQKFNAKLGIVNAFYAYVENTDLQTLKDVAKPYLSIS